jgi:calcium-binding protein CML
LSFIVEVIHQTLFLYVRIYADEDSNGEIDQQELKHCFQKLGIESTDDEIKDLFQACDIYEHMGMKFNEFIVFLCLVYLLNDPAVSEAVSFIQ